jgi:hypothetical protein
MPSILHPTGIAVLDQWRAIRPPVEPATPVGRHLRLQEIRRFAGSRSRHPSCRSPDLL